MPKPILVERFSSGTALAGKVADVGGTWRIAINPTDGAYQANSGDNGLITSAGRLRPSAGSPTGYNTYYVNTTPAVGICQDIFFDAYCASKAGEIFVGINHYPPYNPGGGTIYQQVGVSIEQNNTDPGFMFLSSTGPAYPFSSGFFRPALNASVGSTYKIHLQSREEGVFLYVDNKLVGTFLGLTKAGILTANPGGIVIVVPSTSLVTSDAMGWQIDNLEWYSFDPYPTVKIASTALGAHLQGEVQTKAMLVKLVRSDGTTLGFTTHDVPITVGGVYYESSDGTAATAIRIESGTGVDSMDITGILSSDRVIEDDVRAGRYDNAALTVYECNWADLTQGTIILGRGVIGDITITDGKFVTSFRSLMQRMQQQIGRVYTPNCDVKTLGDARCKVNLAGNTADGYNITGSGWIGYVHSQTSLGISNNADEQGNGTPFGPGTLIPNAGFYEYGTITATNGLNAGITVPVQSQSFGTGTSPQQLAQVFCGAPTLSFSNNPSGTSTVTTLSPLIQPGEVSAAYLEIRSKWTTHSGVTVGHETPGVIVVELPVGLSQRVPVRQVSTTGEYVDYVDFTPEALIALNAVTTYSSAGNFNIGLRFQAPQSNGQQGFDVAITSVVIYMQTTSNQIGSCYEIILAEPFPFPLTRNTTVTMVAGCNRLITRCHEKFDNVLNYRGFPTVPGNSALIAKGRPPG